MNRMQAWARIMLVMMGLYGVICLWRVLWLYSSSILIYWRTDKAFEFSLTSVLYFAITSLFIVLAVVFVYQLIFRADKWATRIIDSWDEEMPANEVFWLAACYRIAAVVLGIVILYWTLPSIIGVCHGLLVEIGYAEMAREQWLARHASYLDNLVGTVLRLALSAYLICGAPHVVRWQVKKTVAQCQEA